MMDVYCGLCGEPWDVWHVNHEFTAHEKRIFKRGLGCEACSWGQKAPKERPLRAMLSAAAMELGDLDGAAADLEDIGFILDY